MREENEEPRQLVLDLPVEERLGRDDFLITPANQAAFAAIDSWPNWPGGMLLLIGPPGSGKTHLAAIWAQRSGAVQITRAGLADVDRSRLDAAEALAIEDCDASRGDEARFFHLLNAIRARGGSLLLTASRGPDLWAIATPDLASRLRLAPTVRLGPADDTLIRAVLVKLFDDRQLVVDAGVVEFIARRLERSVEAARALVRALDRDALARGRRVTRALAAGMLGQQETDAGQDSA